MIQKILLAFVAMAFVFGCSKAPKEYDKNTLVVNERPHERPKEELSEDEIFSSLYDKVKNITSADGEISTDSLLNFDPSSFLPGGEEFDKKVKFNASQPIVYAGGGKGGAAGISFSTTYEESRQIAIPRTAPNADGVAVYDENMVVRWRADEPRTPVFFQMFGGYTGDIQVPSPYSPFKLKHDFSNQYAANTQAGARKMARDFYNMFEGKDQSFDCLSVGYCRVDWGPDAQENFVIALPGMQLLLSKDRFIVFVVMVIKVTPQGPLNADFDIINGRFTIDDQFPALQNQTIGFGDTVESVDQKLNITTETSASTDLYGRNYSGVFLGYHRTRYEREAELPLPTDKMKMVQVYRDYLRNLTINGSPVVVREYANDVQIEVYKPSAPADVENTIAVPSGEFREIPFAINLGLQRQNVKLFAEKVRDFLAAEYAKAYPKATIIPHLTGAQQKKDIKAYTVFVIVYDKTSKNGKFVQLGISEEDGHLQSFTMIDIGQEFNAIDPLVLEDVLNPVIKKSVQRQAKDACGVTGPAMEQLPGDVFNSISGFTIGEVVRVKNWDLGRNEADVTYERGDQAFTARGSYLDRGVQNVAFDVAEKVKSQDQSFVDLGSLTVSLGLKLTCETADERIYKVVSVSTAMKLGMVNDLCGPLKLSFKVGTPAADVLSALQETKCGYKPVYDSGGNGRLVQIYLPSDRIRLNFGDLELSGVTMYTPVNEVK